MCSSAKGKAFFSLDSVYICNEVHNDDLETKNGFICIQEDLTHL